MKDWWRGGREGEVDKERTPLEKGEGMGVSLVRVLEKMVAVGGRGGGLDFLGCGGGVRLTDGTAVAVLDRGATGPLCLVWVRVAMSGQGWS